MRALHEAKAIELAYNLSTEIEPCGLLSIFQYKPTITGPKVAIQRILQPTEHEASALLLAAKLAAAINVQRPIFITDNEILVTVVNMRDLVHSPGHWSVTVVNMRNLVHSSGHWSLRPILADFTATTANMTHSIIKIGRDANSVADNLAKKAR